MIFFSLLLSLVSFSLTAQAKSHETFTFRCTATHPEGTTVSGQASSINPKWALSMAMRSAYFQCGKQCVILAEDCEKTH